MSLKGLHCSGDNVLDNVPCSFTGIVNWYSIVLLIYGDMVFNDNGITNLDF